MVKRRQEHAGTIEIFRTFTRYRAHAVDLYGVSLADCEFECSTNEDAKRCAVSHLRVHSVIGFGKVFVVWRVSRAAKEFRARG
jgi:hypothetical protein